MLQNCVLILKPYGVALNNSCFNIERSGLTLKRCNIKPLVHKIGVHTGNSREVCGVQK